MILSPAETRKIVDLRKQIHKSPELSGKERKTGQLVKDFLKDYPADQVLELADTGLAFIYKSNQPGPVICFRCELDALPIQEINSCDYRSAFTGISHACGHDGHMAMVTGLGMIFGREKPEKGKIIILFQPAEETGAGAAEIVADPIFRELSPDYIIGLHNLPKYPVGSIILKKNEFAAGTAANFITPSKPVSKF